MRCDDARDQASVWLDNELPEPRVRAVTDHMAGCAECRAYANDLRRLSGQVGLLAREPAPFGLGDRIGAALARESGRKPPAVSRWQGYVSLWASQWASQAAAMAAVCLLSVFGTWSVLRVPDAASSAGHDAVAAHVRSLLQDSPIEVASSDRHTVRPWFSGRVEFAPPVRDLTAEGFPLLGGRLDYVDGHRVAALVYKRRLHTISVFVWPEAAPASQAARATVASGLNVLSWSKDGLAWWAVSDCAADELRELRSLL